MIVWSASNVIWFGGRKAQNGQYQWAGKSKELAKLIIWEDGQPNHRGQDCLGSWLQGSYTGKTHDGDCSERHDFMCENLV